MISDDEVQKSLDFLRDTADQSAKFKAERIYLEEYRKSLKALIMKHQHKKEKPMLVQDTKTI